MTSEKPRRRWFQFSLRTMFVVVTALALALAFAGPMIADKVENWLHPIRPFSTNLNLIIDQGGGCFEIQETSIAIENELDVDHEFTESPD